MIKTLLNGCFVLIKILLLLLLIILFIINWFN